MRGDTTRTGSSRHDAHWRPTATRRRYAARSSTPAHDAHVPDDGSPCSRLACVAVMLPCARASEHEGQRPAPGAKSRQREGLTVLRCALQSALLASHAMVNLDLYCSSSRSCKPQTKPANRHQNRRNSRSAINIWARAPSDAARLAHAARAGEMLVSHSSSFLSARSVAGARDTCGGGEAASGVAADSPRNARQPSGRASRSPRPLPRLPPGC